MHRFAFASVGASRARDRRAGHASGGVGSVTAGKHEAQGNRSRGRERRKGFALARSRRAGAAGAHEQLDDGTDWARRLQRPSAAPTHLDGREPLEHIHEAPTALLCARASMPVRGGPYRSRTGHARRHTRHAGHAPKRQCMRTVAGTCAARAAAGAAASVPAHVLGGAPGPTQCTRPAPPAPRARAAVAHRVAKVSQGQPQRSARTDGAAQAAL